MNKCDCLDHCGDDPRVGRGQVHPCDRMRAWINQALAVSLERVPQRPLLVSLKLDREPTQQDLERILHVLQMRYPGTGPA